MSDARLPPLDLSDDLETALAQVRAELDRLEPALLGPMWLDLVQRGASDDQIEWAILETRRRFVTYREQHLAAVLEWLTGLASGQAA